MRRHALRDDQWDRIRDLLPGREGTVGVTARDNRLFVEAVLYRYRTGMPWRDLPERFGDGVQIHRRYSRWAKSGVWERMFRIYSPPGRHHPDRIIGTPASAARRASRAVSPCKRPVAITLAAAA